MPDDNSVPFWADVRLDLASGRKHYQAESFVSDALLPWTASGDPVYSRNITEAVAAFRVRVFCPLPPLNSDGSLRLLNATAGDNPFITATLADSPNPALDGCGLPYWSLTQPGVTAPIPGELGTLQASVSVQDPMHMLPYPNVDEILIVRAGRSYTVAVKITVGDSAGPITAAYSVTMPVINQGEIVNVDIVADEVMCDDGEGCVAAIGRLEMLGANVFGCLNPSVGIMQGPLNNARSAVMGDVSSTLPPVFGYPSANYKLLDVLPSVPEPPASWPITPYLRRAVFYFETTSGYQNYQDFFPGPRINVDCKAPLDNFADWFVINPGFVRSDFRLEGPDCGVNLSCLQLFRSANNLTPCTADHFWYNNPYVQAAGPGYAYGAIKGSAISKTLWQGSTELMLGGPNREPSSVWTPQYVAFWLDNPDDPAHPNFLAFSDRLVDVPLTVQHGQNYQNNYSYCLSEVTLTFVNQCALEIASPTVTGAGDYTGPNPLNISQTANYHVSPTFFGTPTTYMPGNARVRLCLAQGDYLLTPLVAYRDPSDGRTGTTPFFPFPLTVGCKQCINVEVTTNGVGPIISLTNLIDCTSQAEYVLQGAVYAATNHVLTNVSYVLNGGTPVVLCTGATCGRCFQKYSSRLPD